MDPGWYFVMTHSSVDYATDGLTEECEPEMVQVAVLVLAANAVVLSRRNNWKRQKRGAEFRTLGLIK